MSMYNLREYGANYSKKSGRLWQYFRDKPDLDNNNAIMDFPADNNGSALFKFKTKIAGETGNDKTKDVKILVPLKYLSNFCRTFEMLLINCEIDLF